jgi:hypothetical protein
MLYCVSRAMLYYFRLRDLERFSACCSRRHGKYGGQCDKSSHRMIPTNFTRRDPTWGTNRQGAVTGVTARRIEQRIAYSFCSSSGGFATLVAIRRASHALLRTGRTETD